MLAVYRIAIADDEATVREGMRDRIDWPQHGFELVAVCADGQETMRAVEEHRPDVVLADICMPFVDGLELAGGISERFPETRVILLTGYDRIDYAQQAVRHNVTDFLLKPITPAELRAVLDRVRGQLDEDCEERRRRQVLLEQLEASMPLFRERTLNAIVSGESTRTGRRTQRVQRSLQLCGLSFDDPALAVAVIDRDDQPNDERTPEQPEIDAMQMEEILASITGDPGCAPAAWFRTGDGPFAAIFGAAEEEHALRKATEFCESAVSRVKDAGEFTVSAGIGLPVEGISLLARSFRQAREALSYRYRAGGGSVTEFRDLSATPSATGENDSPGTDEVTLSVKTADREDTRRAIEAFVRTLRGAARTASAAQTELVRLLVDLLQAASALSIESDEILRDVSPFRGILEARTLEQAQSAVDEVACRIHDAIEARRADRSRQLALDAKQFIDTRYSDPSLQLADVCRAVGAGSSYFSEVFKRETGRTFLEYLTSVRMEAAKSLMCTASSPMYEIAEAVGYRDPHYFSAMFKRYAGVTPTRYRKSIAGVAGERV